MQKHYQTYERISKLYFMLTCPFKIYYRLASMRSSMYISGGRGSGSCKIRAVRAEFFALSNRRFFASSEVHEVKVCPVLLSIRESTLRVLVLLFLVGRPLDASKIQQNPRENNVFPYGICVNLWRVLLKFTYIKIKMRCISPSVSLTLASVSAAASVGASATQRCPPDTRAPIRWSEVSNC